MIISPALIAVFVLVVYIVGSIKVLAEYERGVIFRLGKLLPQPKGPGVILVFAPIDRMVKVSLRTVVLDVPAAGRHHARQRVGEGQRGALLSRDRSAASDRRSGELHVRHVAARPDDAAQRARTGRARRSALAARASEPRAPADSRRAYRPMGDQGVGGRGEARRSAARHAARDGAAGRSRAREARQDHPRRRRARGVGEARAGRRRDRRPADRDHAPLSADAHRDRVGEELDDHLPAAHRAARDAEDAKGPECSKTRCFASSSSPTRSLSS